MASCSARTGLLAAAVALLWAAAAGLPAAVRAQEPAATLVITQPTPTATPLPPGAVPPATPGARAEQAGVSPYVVQEGDTLLDAALELGLDVEDMGCVIAPDFDPARPLVIGDALPPLPGDVVCHRVASGETLTAIARSYGTTAAAIARVPWNRLHDGPLAGLAAAAPLRAGRYVRVPVAAEQRFEPLVAVAAPQGATPGTDPASFLALMLAQPVNTPPQTVYGMGGVERPRSAAPVPADWPYGSGAFTWPSYGWLTQGYRRDHRALDVAAPAGTPVTASDRGVVVRAGWNDQGYGNFVIVDHNIDYLTLYAHLETIFVQEGEVVGQGQVLGTVGSTGNSTGPHLHFEIRDFGRLVNPLELLAR